MASPQLEEGYTRIANELLEALYAADLNGTQLKIMLYIIRQTYGWHRSEITLSNQEVADAIGTRREHVAKQRGWLRDHGFLTKTDAWRVQKDYTLWGTSVQTHTTDNSHDRQPEIQEQENIGSVQSHTTSVQEHTPASVQSHTVASVQTHTSPTPPYKEKENLKKTPPTARATPKQKRLGLKPFKEPPNEEHLNHPAVQAAITTLKQQPTANQQALIVDTVKDIACWQKVLNLWVANNYRLDRIGDMLDRYGKELTRPETTPYQRTRAAPNEPPIPNTNEYSTLAELRERSKGIKKNIPQGVEWT